MGRWFIRNLILGSWREGQRELDQPQPWIMSVLPHWSHARSLKKCVRCSAWGKVSHRGKTEATEASSLLVCGAPWAAYVWMLDRCSYLTEAVTRISAQRLETGPKGLKARLVVWSQSVNRRVSSSSNKEVLQAYKNHIVFYWVKFLYLQFAQWQILSLKKKFNSWNNSPRVLP